MQKFSRHSSVKLKILGISKKSRFFTCCERYKWRQTRIPTLAKEENKRLPNTGQAFVGLSSAFPVFDPDSFTASTIDRRFTQSSNTVSTWDGSKNNFFSVVNLPLGSCLASVLRKLSNGSSLIWRGFKLQ